MTKQEMREFIARQDSQLSEAANFIRAAEFAARKAADKADCKGQMSRAEKQRNIANNAETLADDIDYLRENLQACAGEKLTAEMDNW